jgi:transposase-like protein
MKRYDKQFRLSVLDYVHKHKELTVYECSRVFGMGYSTLNRWLREERGEKAEPTKEQPMLFNDDDRKEIVKLQQELHEARKTLKVLKDAFELLGR